MATEIRDPERKRGVQRTVLWLLLLAATFYFGFIALAANLTCLALLYQHRNRDVNMSSTFECSRNDVIANTGVIVAAAGVWATGSGWPDILVGSVIAIMFFRSAIRVLSQAWPQFRSERPTVAAALD